MDRQCVSIEDDEVECKKNQNKKTAQRDHQHQQFVVAFWFGMRGCYSFCVFKNIYIKRNTLYISELILKY